MHPVKIGLFATAGVNIFEAALLVVLGVMQTVDNSSMMFQLVFYLMGMGFILKAALSILSIKFSSLIAANFVLACVEIIFAAQNSIETILYNAEHPITRRNFQDQVPAQMSDGLWDNVYTFREEIRRDVIHPVAVGVDIVLLLSGIIGVSIHGWYLKHHLWGMKFGDAETLLVQRTGLSRAPSMELTKNPAFSRGQSMNSLATGSVMGASRPAFKLGASATIPEESASLVQDGAPRGRMMPGSQMTSRAPSVAGSEAPSFMSGPIRPPPGAGQQRPPNLPTGHQSQPLPNHPQQPLSPMAVELHALNEKDESLSGPNNTNAGPRDGGAPRPGFGRGGPQRKSGPMRPPTQDSSQADV